MLRLCALAYNLGNFLRRLALPTSATHWSLMTLREKLIKIGAKVVRTPHRMVFLSANVERSRYPLRTILRSDTRVETGERGAGMTTALPELGPVAGTSGDGPCGGSETAVRSARNELIDLEHEPCSPSDAGESPCSQGGHAVRSHQEPTAAAGSESNGKSKLLDRAVLR